MIYDCFTYYNEQDILRIRLEELDMTVDRFVVVEANQTFTGHPKPYYFDDLPSWIEEWEDRITRVKIKFPADDMSAWDREIYQRNQIMTGLVDASDESLVLISDVDEIPRAGSIRGLDEPYQLDVFQYFWKFNWQVPQHCNRGARPVVARRRHVKDPQLLRASTLSRMPEAGWHFSFFGDHEATKKKIEAFAHTEFDTPEYKAASHIDRCIIEGVDPFGRFPLKYVDIDHTFPRWVQSHTESLSQYILSPAQREQQWKSLSGRSMKTSS